MGEDGFSGPQSVADGTTVRDDGTLLKIVLQLRGKCGRASIRSQIATAKCQETRLPGRPRFADSVGK